MLAMVLLKSSTTHLRTAGFERAGVAFIGGSRRGRQFKDSGIAVIVKGRCMWKRFKGKPSGALMGKNAASGYLTKCYCSNENARFFVGQHSWQASTLMF